MGSQVDSTWAITCRSIVYRQLIGRGQQRRRQEYGRRLPDRDGEHARARCFLHLFSAGGNTAGRFGVPSCTGSPPPAHSVGHVARTSMRPEAEQRGLLTNQETKMLTAAKFALCAAIVLGTAATASAATKRQKTTAHRGGVRVQTSVPRPAPLVNPFSPAATGGGTPGYNQMLERY